MTSRIKKRHIIALIVLGIVLTAAIFWYRSDENRDTAHIRPFNKERDYAALVTLINNNKFWIAEQPDAFPTEQFLSLQAPQNDPKRKGQAHFYVMDVDGKAAGLVAYHKKSAREGLLWILVVDKRFRGRQFGKRLVEHALHDLKKQGASYVTLATRLINKAALALYKKLGFVESHRYEDRGMIFMIRKF